MELKITNKKEEPLLFRTEILAEGIAEGATPSNADIKKVIASELKSDESLIVIENIKTYFGSLSFLVRVHKYKDAEALKKVVKQKKAKVK